MAEPVEKIGGRGGGGAQECHTSLSLKTVQLGSDPHTGAPGALMWSKWDSFSGTPREPQQSHESCCQRAMVLMEGRNSGSPLVLE